MLLLVLNQIASISESIIIANFVVASLGTKSKKHTFIYTAALAILLYMDLFVLNNRIIHNSNIIALIQIMICLLFEFIFLSGSIYKKLLMPLLSTILTLMINMFLLFFFSSMYHVNTDLFTESANIYSFMIVLFARILYLFVSYFLISVQHKSDFHLSRNEWIGVMTIYISTLCVGCSVFTMKIKELDYENPYIFVITLGLVLINLFSFYFIRMISKDKLEKMKYSILEVQFENQKKDVIALNQQYTEMMKLRHDYKNYVLCCQTLLTDHKYEEALQYLNTLTQDKFSQTKFSHFSDNMALNAILNAKYHVCEECGFVTSFIVSSTCTEIDEIDLSILLANLLDNSIEACRRNVGESKIITSISKENSYIHIQVKNTIETSVLKNNPKLTTSKRDKASHGYGIQTITDITRKYDGMQEFFEKDNFFIADIWLNT